MERILVSALLVCMMVSVLAASQSVLGAPVTRNEPPMLTQPFEDVHMREDNVSSGVHLMDLWEYFDDDNGSANLTYSISYQENASLLEAVLDGGHFVNFVPVTENWSGTLVFELTATDAGEDGVALTDDDLQTSARFNVTVDPVNDPPGSVAFTYTVVGSSTSDNVTVIFRAVAAEDVDGDMLTYRWDVNSDGIAEEEGVDLLNITYSYPSEGNYTVNLSVTDPEGLESHIENVIFVIAPPSNSSDDGFDGAGVPPASGGTSDESSPDKSVYLPASLSIIPISVALGGVLIVALVFVVVIVVVVAVARRKQDGDDMSSGEDDDSSPGQDGKE